VALLLSSGEAFGQVIGQPLTLPTDLASASATASDALPDTTFRTGVDLVALSVVVTDGEQQFVTGLMAGDFAVFEDGVQQDLSFFAASDVPLDLAILLDTSASMTDKMETVQQAAIGFASTLREGDRLIVVDIKDATRVLSPLSRDIEGAKRAILTTFPKGGTALYNGLYLTLREMATQARTNGEVRRQAIVVLSDGDDTASLLAFEDVMDLAKRSGISIYTITLQSPWVIRQSARGGLNQFSESEFTMKALAQETGARSFFPKEIGELTGVYDLIAEELASQYALGYTSRNSVRDGAYRRLLVQVPDRPGVRTRTRSGYLSASGGRSE
jgi:Ca-activated chloride channel family protein